MLVGACISCGVPYEYIEAELRKLDLPGESFTTTAGNVHRASIHATKFDVWVDDRSDSGGEHSNDHEHWHEHGEHAGNGDDQCDRHERSHERVHSHTHSHSHSHSHSSSDIHSHSHTEEHSHSHQSVSAHDKPERALSEILDIIAKSGLDAGVKKLASRIFERLGRAEAAVHGVPIDQVHFHEVGAVDAICDIVGFAIAYNKLGIDVAYVSPLPLGAGTVQTRHGRYPVPGPAVLALLQECGARTSDLSLPYECLTPTGAAILSTIGNVFGAPPAFERIERVGYGAGSLNSGTHPNVVRLIVGQAVHASGHPSEPGFEGLESLEATGSCQAEVVAVVEANIDDMAPHVMAYAMEKLLQGGALDVSLTPIVMKKGRLAQKLTVIARPADRQAINALILAETTTIGTRSYFCERLTLSRDFQEISIGDGPKIRLKVSRDTCGAVINVQPEYEDCITYAKESNLPLKDVLIRCLSKASELLDSRNKA